MIFCKLQPPKLYKSVQELFCQAEKLFSAEIWATCNNKKTKAMPRSASLTVCLRLKIYRSIIGFISYSRKTNLERYVAQKRQKKGAND